MCRRQPGLNCRQATTSGGTGHLTRAGHLLVISALIAAPGQLGRYDRQLQFPGIKNHIRADIRRMDDMNDRPGILHGASCRKSFRGKNQSCPHRRKSNQKTHIVTMSRPQHRLRTTWAGTPDAGRSLTSAVSQARLDRASARRFLRRRPRLEAAQAGGAVGRPEVVVEAVAEEAASVSLLIDLTVSAPLQTISSCDANSFRGDTENSAAE